MRTERGLTAKIFRSSFKDELAIFKEVDDVTIVGYEIASQIPFGENVPDWEEIRHQVFEPTEKRPAAIIVYRWIESQGKWHQAHFLKPADTKGHTMFSGSYVGTSDSRFSAMSGTYGAIPLHDRVER